MGSRQPSPASLNLKATPVKSLFLGRIEEDNLFPFPELGKEEKETLSMVIESIDKFLSGKGELFREFDKSGVQPPDYLALLKELGLFGLIVPEEFGGVGLSNSGYSRILQQVTRYDGSTSLTVGAHSSIGMKGLLLFGTPAQKAKYLPKLASGETIAAFCLTESGSGSDAASIKTSAVKQSDGSWILNGEKIWITNGPLADFYTVFARTDTDAGKISAFIVERGAGVSNGPKEDKMGIRASATTTVVFQDVRIPAENLLGEEGKGFKVAMAILNNGRTGLGGGCVGAMKRCIALSSKQATERKQFGRSISEFPLVKDKIAQMTIQCFVTESLVSMVGYYIDSGVDDYSIEAAVSKIFASESLWQVANEALQIAGGNGFMKDFPYEMIVRDSRINLIFEGTNEILRLYIGLAGLKEAGEYLKDVQKGLGKFFNDPIKGFGVLGGYVQKKIHERTEIGRDKMIRVHEVFSGEARSIEWFSAELSKASERTLRKDGKNIIGQQLPTKRFADIAIDLFAALCTLSRVTAMIEERGEAACATEISIARIFVRQAKRRMNLNLRRFEKNEDAEMVLLGDEILKNGEYRWDVL